MPSHPHRPVAGKHWGLALVQRTVFVGEHSVQAPASGPDIWHAGRAGSVQLGAPSDVQGPQVRVVVEQTGEVPPQSVFVRQPTQTPPPEVVSQSGLVAGHREVSFAVHVPQPPLGRQSGLAALQSALEPQPWQIPRVALQTGVVPLQWALV